MNKVIVAAVLGLATSLSAYSETLFSGGHEDDRINVSAGWVAKQWVTRRNGMTLRENLWGEPDKMLHGLQIGVSGQLCAPWGLGFRSGLYYEWYVCADRYLRDRGWDRFNEHDLYVPLHAIFRIPLATKISITPFGGVGVNWAIYGNFKNGVITDALGLNWDVYTHFPRPGMSEMQTFDYDNHTPHHWNVQAEAGVAIRIYRVKASFTYSWGLNHHTLYDDAYSLQNKLAVNIAYAFGEVD